MYFHKVIAVGFITKQNMDFKRIMNELMSNKDARFFLYVENENKECVPSVKSCMCVSE